MAFEIWFNRMANFRIMTDEHVFKSETCQPFVWQTLHLWQMLHRVTLTNRWSHFRSDSHETDWYRSVYHGSLDSKLQAWPAKVHIAYIAQAISHLIFSEGYYEHRIVSFFTMWVLIKTRHYVFHLRRCQSVDHSSSRRWSYLVQFAQGTNTMLQIVQNPSTFRVPHTLHSSKTLHYSSYARYGSTAEFTDLYTFLLLRITITSSSRLDSQLTHSLYD